MLQNADQEGRNEIGRVGLQILAILIIVPAALFAFKYALVEQLAASNSIYMDLTTGMQTNPEVLAEFARQEHADGNLEQAQQLYVRALDSFTLHTASWLGLAEVLKDRDKNSEAVAVLQTLDTLPVDDIDLLWQKARLARELQQDAILLSTLQQMARDQRIPGRRIFNLAGEYWDDPQFLLHNFDAVCYPDILGFCIRNNRLDKARIVWHALKKAGVRDRRTTIAYISFLLENNKFTLAAEEWRDAFQKDGILLYNGNFEEPILNTAFGWKVAETKGVSLQPDNVGGGLTISFDGTENTIFMLSQVVPLQPGEYVFRGAFETTALTSQQRPYFLISGYNCQGLYIEDAMLPPSEYTTQFAIPFSVPEACNAVRINLIRNRANPYDRNISGKLTLSDLAIARVFPLQEEPAVPETAATGRTVLAGNPPDARRRKLSSAPIASPTTIHIHPLVIRD